MDLQCRTVQCNFDFRLDVVAAVSVEETDFQGY